MAVNPPRAAFLDYPLGHSAGKPGDPEQQRDILVAALSLFETTAEAGSLETLPFQWDEAEAWKSFALGGDMRLERFETPQYQNEEDRQKVETGDQSALGMCSGGACFAPPR